MRAVRNMTFLFLWMQYFSTLIKCCQTNKSIHISCSDISFACAQVLRKDERCLFPLLTLIQRIHEWTAADFYAASAFLDSFFSISNSYVLRKLNAGLYTKRIFRNTWIPSVLVSNNLLRRVRAGAGEKCGHRGVEKCTEVGKYPNTHTETICIGHTYKAYSNLEITKRGNVWLKKKDDDIRRRKKTSNSSTTKPSGRGRRVF